MPNNIEAGKLAKHLDKVKLVIDLISTMSVSVDLVLSDVKDTLLELRRQGIEPPASIEKIFCGLELKGITKDVAESNETAMAEPKERFVVAFCAFGACDAMSDDEDESPVSDDTKAFDMLKPVIGFMGNRCCTYLGFK